MRRDPHRSPADPLPDRLAALDDELAALVAQVRPSAMAVERVLFQTNARTAMSVGQASGLALVVAARAGVPVAQYSPNEVKLAVTGDGRADKLAVQTMVDAAAQRCARSRKPADAADALALACCHSWRAPLAAQVADRHRDRLGARHGDRTHARAARCSSRSGASATACSCRSGAMPRSIPGANAFLFTHLHVREDAMVLFGFPTRDERDTFEALIARDRRRTEARARDPVGAHAGALAALPRRGRSRRARARCPASASAPRSGCSSS